MENEYIEDARRAYTAASEDQDRLIDADLDTQDTADRISLAKRAMGHHLGTVCPKCGADMDFEVPGDGQSAWACVIRNVARSRLMLDWESNITGPGAPPDDEALEEYAHVADGLIRFESVKARAYSNKASVAGRYLMVNRRWLMRDGTLTHSLPIMDCSANYATDYSGVQELRSPESIRAAAGQVLAGIIVEITHTLVGPDGLGSQLRLPPEGI